MIDPELDSKLDPYFEELRGESGRDPERAEAGRAAFLAEARALRAAVSNAPAARLNHRQTVRKERFTMIKIAGSILMALAMVAGGGGVTVAAAQASMPGDALYPVKLWSEDAYLAVTADPQEDLNLALQFADRRAEEIVNQVGEGDAVANELLLRLVEEDELALGIAAGLEGEAGEAALLKVRERMEVHERVLVFAGQGQGPADQALMTQVRDHIRQRLEVLNQGDQSQLQQQINQQTQLQQQINQPETAGEGGGQSEGAAGAGQGDGQQGAGNGSGAGTSTGAAAGVQDDEYNCTCSLVTGSGSGFGFGSGQDVECDCDGEPQSGAGNGGSGGGNGNR